MEVLVTGLRFTRDGRPVLDIPSLRFRAGRRTAILGPNGSGKTTLLRLIAALERPQTGEIRIGDRPVRPDDATRHALAFVFQEPIFLARSVRDNLALGLALRRVPAAERKERIGHAVTLLGVAHLLDRRADRLSGGEARRVGLARALALRAPLVLLDEPLSGLDAAGRNRLADELPRILEAFGATTLFVTHDRDEALRLADDLVVLAAGEVRAAGNKREVVTGVKSRAVALALGYTVLGEDDACIAVPRGGLRAGPGRRSWRMVVEEVVDLVERREAVGRCGSERVRVPLGDASHTPVPGEALVFHAEGTVFPIESP